MVPHSLRFSASLFILFSLLLASCGGERGGEEEGQPSTSLFKKALQKPVAVTTTVVTTHEVPLVITEDGKTEAADRYQAKAPATVKVQKIFVEEGARVQPGDPLVQFNDETLALKLNVARAEIREAEAGLAAFGSVQERPAAREPVEGEEAAEPQAEEVNVAEGRNALYQAQLERARAEVDLFEKMADLQQLNSPIAGIAGRHEVSEGSEAVEDQVLLEIVKLDPIDFTFRVPLENVAYLERGPEVVVRFAAFPGQDFTGEVAIIGTGAIEGNGVEVKVRISNPDLVLKTDLKGMAEVRTNARRRIVTIPESAVVKTDKNAYAYKLEGGRARRVPIDLGTSNGGQVEIEKGLIDGNTVIVSAAEGMEALSDGAPVEAQASQAER